MEKQHFTTPRKLSGEQTHCISSKLEQTNKNDMWKNSKLIFFVIIFGFTFTRASIAQEIQSFIERGTLETVYNNIREQCQSDSIAIVVLEREYVVKGLKINAKKLSKKEPRYIQLYIQHNKAYWCILEDCYYNSSLVQAKKNRYNSYKV